MPIITKPDTYTTLLIHSDTTDDGNTTFVDSAKGGYAITNNDSVTHETGLAKFGTSSMHFNGTTDYLTVPSNAGHNFTNSDSYTVDFWMYPTATSGNPTIYSGWGCGDSSASAGDHYLYYSQSSGTLFWGAVNVNSAGAEWNPGLTLTDNLWQHIALVYDADGGHAYAFKDGIRQNSVSGPAVCSITANDDLFKIGDNNNIDFFKGNLDEFRVSKGIARWTSDFTPPNKPYSVIDDDFVTDVAHIKDQYNSTTVSNNLVIKSDPGEASTDVIFSISDKDGNGFMHAMGSRYIGMGRYMVDPDSALEVYGGGEKALHVKGNDHDALYIDTVGNSPYIINARLKNGGTGFQVESTSTSTGLINWVGGALHNNSDRTLKKDITNLGSCLDKVNNLRGVTFKWKGDNDPYRNDTENSRHQMDNIGFIAQEIEAEFPDIIDTNDNTGLKSIRNNNLQLTAVLVEAIKELSSEIKSLKNRIEVLEG